MCVLTIGRILKRSNKEIFLQLCEIIAVPTVLSGCENWNLEFNEYNLAFVGRILAVSCRLYV